MKASHVLSKILKNKYNGDLDSSILEHTSTPVSILKLKESFQDFSSLLNGADRNPEKLLEDIKNAGITGAVLSQPYLLGHEDLDEVKEADDAILNIIKKYDEFYGLAAIPLSLTQKLLMN